MGKGPLLLRILEEESAELIGSAREEEIAIDAAEWNFEFSSPDPVLKPVNVELFHPQDFSLEADSGDVMHRYPQLQEILQVRLDWR